VFVSLLGAPAAVGAGVIAAPNTSTEPASPGGSDRVSVMDFGAKCDRVADDTAAVQAAINHCARSIQWKDLHVPGGCRITAPLIIDRPVDTMVGEFRIIGGGDGGGFYVDSAIAIFDSAAAVTTDPKSEHVGFYNIQFEASDPALAAYVMSKKFLRIGFNNCYFQKIKAYASPIYMQSFRFQGCKAKGWRGPFGHSAILYDCSWVDCTFEAAPTGAGVYTGSAHAVRLVNNLFEGSLGPFYQMGAGSGVTIIGNYTEGNTRQDYILTDSPNRGITRGVVFAGNFMQLYAPNLTDEAFWNVAVGDVRGMASAGNYCNGKMFDDSATGHGNLTSVGDGAMVRLNKSLLPIALAPDAPSFEASVVCHPPRLAAGVQDAIRTLMVSGALPGDLVDTSFSADLAGVDLKAWVSAPNTVKFAFTNLTSGTVSLGRGTVKVRVRR